MQLETRERRAPARGSTSPRPRRRALVVAAVVVGIGALVATSLYGPQLWSVLTHRKGAPTATWVVPRFPADDVPEVRIAAVGDVGEGEEEEWRTAWAIRRLSFDGAPYDAVLFLGDNVYPSGDPSRLDDTIVRPFTVVTDHGADVLAIVGNHDAAHADEQMRILGMPGTWWTTSIGDVRIVGLDSNRIDDPAQLAFLERTLREATEPWRIVAVHEPPYSSGYQGSNEVVRGRFVPLFERYGVQLVLSGHEHDYQRSLTIDGVTYVVSGAAGRTRGTGEERFTAASWSVLHFVDVNVFGDRIVLRAVDQDARMFDAAEILPGGSSRTLTPPG